MKELLDMLVAERMRGERFRKTVRLSAARLGWRAVKDGPSASAFLLKRSSDLHERAGALSKLAGKATDDPAEAMASAQARLETIEAVLAEYRKKLSSLP
jgi:hypothetical protein